MFLGEFALLRVFSRTALFNSVETYVAYIFHFVCFQMDLGFLPAHVCFYFNLIQQPAKKFKRNVILLILSFRSQKNLHFLGLTIKRNYFNGGWKKKFVAKRHNFYIRCFKTTVNDGKFEQDKNLQNPLRTRAKNKQSARKYPLRENTLPHPNSFNSIMMASFLPVSVSQW